MLIRKEVNHRPASAPNCSSKCFFTACLMYCCCRSVLELSLSCDVGSSLKASLNSLLTSLCRLNPAWFTVAMTTVQKLFPSVSLERQGRLLHSLGHLALSDPCINILLKSAYINELFQTLHLKIVTLSDPQDKSPEDLSCLMYSICQYLAFFTDLAFGHNAAQVWLVQDDHAQFWPMLLRIFSESPPTLNKDELGFCQFTVQQLVSVCIKFYQHGRQLLSNVLINALQGVWSTSLCDAVDPPLNLKLTPFIRRLIVDHILRPEAVHVVLALDHSLVEILTGLTSITPTYESPHYHPSLPVGVAYYYLKVSSESTLYRMYALVMKDKPHPSIKTNESLTSSKISDSSKVVKKKLAQEPKKVTPLIDIFQFKDIDVSPNDPIPKDIPDVYFTVADTRITSVDTGISTDRGTDTIPLQTKIRTIPSSSCSSHIRAVTLHRLIQEKQLSEEKQTLPQEDLTPSMFRVFSESGGLRLLSCLLPHLHGAFSELTYIPSIDCDVDITSLLPVSPVTFLPPCSYVMLGLGMRLDEYNAILCTGHSNMAYLMKGLLGVTDDSELLLSLSPFLILSTAEKQLSSSYHDILSFLPFLSLNLLLQKLPSCTARGHALRKDMCWQGIIHHVLMCLSTAAHLPTRYKEAETVVDTTSLAKHIRLSLSLLSLSLSPSPSSLVVIL